MSRYCLRPLFNNILTETFVQEVLEIDNRQQLRNACNIIVDAENQWHDLVQQCTLTHEDYRDLRYRSSVDREKLRVRIFKELVTLERLPNENQITLGKGGMLPTNGIKSEKKAYYIIGLPASGKSTIANTIADFTHSAIVDNDYAKRKLPEFRVRKCGATLVHDESDYIVFRNPQYCVIEFCVMNGYNIVIPKVGGSLDSVLTLTKSLKKRDYCVYLVLIDLDRKIAVQRAYIRFKSTKRYVPLSLIFDGYSNDPILTYYRLKQLNANEFDGFLQISTSSKKPHIVESDRMDDVGRHIYNYFNVK